VSVPSGSELVIAVDTLVAGVHFPLDTAPEDVGHKALAVNLSDLAAMGAEPLGHTVVLTRAAADPAWLARFESGITALADCFGCPRVASLAPKGPLSVTVEVYGHVPAGAALRRAGASPGDGVYVSGTLGDAGLALAARFAGLDVPGPDRAWAERRLARPEPRLSLGRALRGLATSAIDVSDGMAGDLGHVLTASGVGASIEAARLPLSPALARVGGPAAWRLALGGGDDYELCFSAPPSAAGALRELARRLDLPLTRVGTVEAEPGLRCLDPQGQPLEPPPGYQHFRAPSEGSGGD
jgi:thiamine-monophosphate kinase